MSDETRVGQNGGASSGVGPRLAVDSEFAGHRVESELGRGGMGVVYRARHLALDASRALKVIAPGLSADPMFRQRFQRESRLAASIDHPNVITVHHAGEEGELLYISMRLVDGADLRELIEAQGPSAPARAAAIIAAVAAALDAAHASGLVHRDVKPANVLIESATGGADRVFLTDFGISRVSGGGSTVTSTGELLGSVDYVAPEQIEGAEVDRRADVYSLGCLAHFVLTGEPPFPRETSMARLYAHANAPRPRPSTLRRGLPKRVDAVVARATAVAPGDRYSSAGAMASDLTEALRGLGPEDVETVVSERSGRSSDSPPRRRRLLLAALGAVALAAVAAVLLLSGGSDSGADRGPPPATAGSVRGTIVVKGTPSGVDVGGVAVWVASGRKLTSINPSKDKVELTPAVPGRSVAVATGFGSVWIADRKNGAVIRLDPRTGKPPLSIPTGSSPSDVVIGAGSVWIANEGDGTVSRIDPVSNTKVKDIRVGQAPRSLAAGGGAIWVANIDGQSISKIDAGSGKIRSNPVEVGPRPNDLAYGAGALWVCDVFAGTVTKIDAKALRVSGDPIKVGARPRGIKVGYGSVWVANGGDGTVTRIDAADADQIGDPIPVGDEPADLALGKGSVWTADSGGGQGPSTVTRIDP